jgi:hypothetical protein
VTDVDATVAAWDDGQNWLDEIPSGEILASQASHSSIGRPV